MGELKIKNRKNVNWIFLLLTFAVSLGGAYFSQIFLNNILGNEDNTEQLSYETSEPINTEYFLEKNEDIIENAMKSVVGISKLQANEESLFDIALSRKWGMRYWNNCI